MRTCSSLYLSGVPHGEFLPFSLSGSVVSGQQVLGNPQSHVWYWDRTCENSSTVIHSVYGYDCDTLTYLSCACVLAHVLVASILYCRSRSASRQCPSWSCWSPGTLVLPFQRSFDPLVLHCPLVLIHCTSGPS